jgi:hypothetical protein
VNYDAGFYAAGLAVADFNGDGKPDFAVTTESVGVLLNNNGASPTTTTLTSNKNPVKLNQALIYAATVSSQSGTTPGGTVTFKDGVTALGTAPVVNNLATFTIKYKTPSTTVL